MILSRISMMDTGRRVTVRPRVWILFAYHSMGVARIIRPSAKEQQIICREGNPEIQLIRNSKIVPTVSLKTVNSIDSPFQQDDASHPVGTMSKCPECGKEFVLEYDHQKFCSHKCSVKHHNLLAKRKRELMKDDPAFIARKRLLNDRRNERRAAARAALLGISVDELMRGRDPHKRGRPRKVQEHEVKPDVNWKEEVLKVLSMPDPAARFEASRKWTDEERRYAKSIYLGMLRDDFSYRRESFC